MAAMFHCLLSVGYYNIIILKVLVRPGCCQCLGQPAVPGDLPFDRSANGDHFFLSATRFLFFRFRTADFRVARGAGGTVKRRGEVRKAA